MGRHPGEYGLDSASLACTSLLKAELTLTSQNWAVTISFDIVEGMLIPSAWLGFLCKHFICCMYMCAVCSLFFFFLNGINADARTLSILPVKNFT